MSSLCTLLGFSRQAFYNNQVHKTKERYETELIIQQVLKHRSIMPKLGTRKLLILLQAFVNEHQIKLGRDGLFTLLREHGLLVKKHKTRIQTTFSKHWHYKYPNLIREYIPLAPNLLWVSDITYIPLEVGHSYLSLITDAYSRKIVGFYLSKTLEAIGSINALQMAISNCKDTSQLMHHSDRGVQYCCLNYVDILTSKNIQISMTENGDPLENAIAERVNGILKNELLQLKYKDYDLAQKGVATAIVIYNSKRPHGSCDMLTPDKAHHQKGELKKHWKNYYKKKEVEMNEP